MFPLILALVNTSFFDFNVGLETAPEDEIIIISDGFNFDVGFLFEGDWHPLTPLERDPLGWKLMDEDR